MTPFDFVHAFKKAAEARFGGVFVTGEEEGQRLVKRGARDRAYGPIARAHGRDPLIVDVELLMPTPATERVELHRQGVSRRAPATGNVPMVLAPGLVFLAHGPVDDRRLAAALAARRSREAVDALVEGHWEGFLLALRFAWHGPVDVEALLDDVAFLQEQLCQAARDGVPPVSLSRTTPLSSHVPGRRVFVELDDEVLRATAVGTDERARVWVQAHTDLGQQCGGTLWQDDHAVHAVFEVPPSVGALTLRPQRGLAGWAAEWFEDSLSDLDLDRAYVVKTTDGVKTLLARRGRQALLRLGRVRDMRLEWARGRLEVSVMSELELDLQSGVGSAVAFWTSVLANLNRGPRGQIAARFDDEAAEKTLTQATAPFSGIVEHVGDALLALVHLGGHVDFQLKGTIEYDGNRLTSHFDLPSFEGSLRLVPRRPPLSEPGPLGFEHRWRSELDGDHAQLLCERADSLVDLADLSARVHCAPAGARLTVVCGREQLGAATGLALSFWRQAAVALLGL